MRTQLQHVAHTRSGDKGDISNVVVVAYTDRLYPFVKEQLTADHFKAFYGATIHGRVDRYAIDGLAMLNFVAHGALGGGVSRSLRLDQYGKSLAAAILGFQLEIPDSLHGDLVGVAEA